MATLPKGDAWGADASGSKEMEASKHDAGAQTFVSLRLWQSGGFGAEPGATRKESTRHTWGVEPEGVDGHGGGHGGARGEAVRPLVRREVHGTPGATAATPAGKQRFDSHSCTGLIERSAEPGGMLM